MQTVQHIFEMIKTLSPPEKRELKMRLLEIASSIVFDMESYLTEERFANGRVCILCGCDHVVRNGHQANGSQRYLCKGCGRSFVITSNSIVSGTRKSLGVWEKYVACMMLGLSLRKTAEICRMHRNTAFIWRHKILDTLRSTTANVELDGIVEMDETFFAVSYKGNHSKNPNFELPREVHRRGKQTHKRGLSREQVCVPCAVDRNGTAVAKASNLGRVSIKDIQRVFDGRINKHAILVTDKMNSYVRFANESGFKLVQLKGGKSKHGIYNIQHVNGYHGRLKKFMSNFNGVSSKYLNNYLAWSGLVNYAKQTDAEKRNILLRLALTIQKTISAKDLVNRNPIPLEFC